MSEDRFWRFLKEKFEEISAALEGVHVPSINELDAYKVAMKYPGLISSVLQAKRQAGYSIFPPEAKFFREHSGSLLDADTGSMFNAD